jgi:hypothetical protein
MPVSCHLVQANMATRACKLESSDLAVHALLSAEQTLILDLALSHYRRSKFLILRLTAAIEAFYVFFALSGILAGASSVCL